METTENIEKITITKKEYEQLLRDSRQLNHLHANGVDNWEGYTTCCDEESEEDIYGEN